MSRLKQIIFVAIIILLGLGIGIYVYKNHYTPAPPAEDTVVTVWYTEDDALNAGIPGIVDKYNSVDNRDIRKNVTVRTRSFTDYGELEKALRLTSKSTRPDMIVCDANCIATLNGDGYIAKLSEYGEEWASSEFNADLVECVSIKNNMMAVPFAADIELMVVNTKCVDNFGEIKSLEDMCAAAKSYYKDNSKPMFTLGDYAKFFRNEMAQLGEEFDAVSPRDTKNENCKYIYKLLAQSAFDRGMISSTDPLKAVASGKIACAAVSSSDIMANATELGKGIKVFPCPCVKDGKQVYDLDVKCLCLCKTDETRQNASAQFLKWFSSAEVNTEFLGDGGYIPLRGSIGDIASENSLFTNVSKVILKLESSAKHTNFEPNAEYLKNYKEFTDVMSLVMDSLS